MLRVTARLFKDNQLVGYRLSDGQQQRDLTIPETWMYAKNKMIENVRATGDTQQPGLSGTNGFELKKLPQIKWERNKTGDLRGAKFTTQDLLAAGIRHANDHMTKSIDNRDDALRCLEGYLKEDVNNGVVSASNLRKLSPYIKIVNTLGSTHPGGSIGVAIPSGEELEKQKKEFKQSIDRQIETVELSEQIAYNVIDELTAYVKKYGSNDVHNDIIASTIHKCCVNTVKTANLKTMKIIDMNIKEFKELVVLSLGSVDGKEKIISNISSLDDNKAKILKNKATTIFEELKEEIRNTEFKPKRALCSIPAIVGYKIQYTGPVPIQIMRIAVQEPHTQVPYTIEPNSEICLSRAELALMSSRPEISCTFANGKLVESSKIKPGLSSYAYLNKKYVALDNTSVHGIKIPINKAVDARTIITYFEE